jgi:hypothetical protein
LPKAFLLGKLASLIHFSQTARQDAHKLEVRDLKGVCVNSKLRNGPKLFHKLRKGSATCAFAGKTLAFPGLSGPFSCEGTRPLGLSGLGAKIISRLERAAKRAEGRGFGFRP